MFVKSVIAVFLVLAIANPACCCSFEAHRGHSTTQNSSCCSGKSKPSDDKDGKPCTCSLAKEKIAPEAKVFAVESSGSHPLPEIPELPATESIGSVFPETISFIKRWPPCRMPVPTTGSRLAAKCSYLI